MSGVLTLSLAMACPEQCSKPFSAFTIPFYLAFSGGWLDLAYKISGVLVLGPKLQFQEYFQKNIVMSLINGLSKQSLTAYSGSRSIIDTVEKAKNKTKSNCHITYVLLGRNK
jgi:ethanolamine transporter EutH